MLDNEIFSKYENEFIKCLDKENIVKIVKFLQSEKVDYIESGSFPVSQFFASDGQSIGVSVLASVLPMNILD